MTIESRVSIGIVETNRQQLKMIKHEKWQLYSATYYYIKNKVPTYELPDSLLDTNMEMLDRIRKNEYITKKHKDLDKSLESLLREYGMSFIVKKGQPQYSLMFNKLEEKMNNFVKSYKEGFALIAECTPDWAKIKNVRDERRSLFNKAVEKEIKEKQVIKEQVSFIKKGRNKNKAWYIIDPKFLTLGDPIEGVMFPRGTVLSEAFPEEWKGFPKASLKDSLNSKTEQKLLLIKEKMQLKLEKKW